MKHTKLEEAFLNGFWFARKGFSAEKAADYLAIKRLNNRSADRWTNDNNAGWDRGENYIDPFWIRALELAARNRWTLSAPGLYWEIFAKVHGRRERI